MLEDLRSVTEDFYRVKGSGSFERSHPTQSDVQGLLVRTADGWGGVGGFCFDVTTLRLDVGRRGGGPRMGG